MCQSPQTGAEPDRWSGEESDTTSCRAKEEERASFGEERRSGGAGKEKIEIDRGVKKRRRSSSVERCVYVCV